VPRQARPGCVVQLVAAVSREAAQPTISTGRERCRVPTDLRACPDSPSIDRHPGQALSRVIRHRSASLVAVGAACQPQWVWLNVDHYLVRPEGPDPLSTWQSGVRHGSRSALFGETSKLWDTGIERGERQRDHHHLSAADGLPEAWPTTTTGRDASTAVRIACR
jgi:hypothetical protein